MRLHLKSTQQLRVLFSNLSTQHFQAGADDIEGANPEWQRLGVKVSRPSRGGAKDRTSSDLGVFEFKLCLLDLIFIYIFSHLANPPPYVDGSTRLQPDSPALPTARLLLLPEGQHLVSTIITEPFLGYSKSLVMYLMLLHLRLVGLGLDLTPQHYQYYNQLRASVFKLVFLKSNVNYSQAVTSLNLVYLKTL